MQAAASFAQINEVMFSSFEQRWAAVSSDPASQAVIQRLAGMHRKLSRSMAQGAPAARQPKPLCGGVMATMRHGPRAGLRDLHWLASDCLAIRLAVFLGMATQEEAVASKTVRDAALGQITGWYQKYFIDNGNELYFTLDNLLPMKRHASWSQQDLRELSAGYTRVRGPDLIVFVTVS